MRSWVNGHAQNPRKVRDDFGEWRGVPTVDLHDQLEQSAARKELGNPGECQSTIAEPGPVKLYPKNPKLKSKVIYARPSSQDH